MAFLNAANEARRPAVARCGLMKGTDGVRSAGGGRFRLGDMPATASRRRSAGHKTQGAGGLAIEHHRPLPSLRVCPCAWLRCRRSGRLFGIVAVVVVAAVLIAVQLQLAAGCSPSGAGLLSFRAGSAEFPRWFAETPHLPAGIPLGYASASAKILAASAKILAASAQVV